METYRILLLYQKGKDFLRMACGMDMAEPFFNVVVRSNLLFNSIREGFYKDNKLNGRGSFLT